MHQQVYEPFQESLCRDAQTADVVAFDAESQPKMLDYTVIHFGRYVRFLGCGSVEICFLACLF